MAPSQTTFHAKPRQPCRPERQETPPGGKGEEERARQDRSEKKGLPSSLPHTVLRTSIGALATRTASWQQQRLSSTSDPIREPCWKRARNFQKHSDAGRSVGSGSLLLLFELRFTEYIYPKDLGMKGHVDMYMYVHADRARSLSVGIPLTWDMTSLFGYRENQRLRFEAMQQI